MATNRIKVGEFEPAEPFSFTRLYDSIEKYQLQNMMLCQVRMPHTIYQGEKMWDVWGDRIGADSVANAWKHIVTTGSGDHALAEATPDSLLAFSQSLNDEINGAHSFTVTGMLAVRFTNHMSGYPTIRVSMVGDLAEGRTVYSGMSGPNIIRPKRGSRGITPNGAFAESF